MLANLQRKHEINHTMCIHFYHCKQYLIKISRSRDNGYDLSWNVK